MKAEYITVIEASKEVVWLCKFLSALDIIPGMDKPLYCDNTMAISNKDSRHHMRCKHIDRKYQIIRDFVESWDVVIKVASVDNLVDPFIKTGY